MYYTNATQTTDTELNISTDAARAKMTHLTLIFNTFVFLQLFNLLNCERVGVKDIKIFENFRKNYMFLIIWIAVITL